MTLQGFPDNFKPINEWTPESKGWKNVVAGIRKTITDLQSQAMNRIPTREYSNDAWTIGHGNELAYSEAD